MTWGTALSAISSTITFSISTDHPRGPRAEDHHKETGPDDCRHQAQPTGPFERGETIDPAHIGYLIKMPEGRDGKRPRWLELLRQLFSGIYTADNLDYVQRDAFMTGFSLDMVDISRLRFYTFFTEHGITLHQAGISPSPGS